MPKVTNSDRLERVSDMIDELVEGIPLSEYIEFLEDVKREIGERRYLAAEDEARAAKRHG